MGLPTATVLARDAELASIDGWLAALPSAGKLSLLVITGEPGIGKTTLWAEATRRATATGYQVLSSRPVPSDAGLPHVALADLLRRVTDEALELLPAPQRRPLTVALLRADPGDGDLDPRAVGTGLTALLDRLAAEGPLVVAIDDAQWLDPATARVLAFALRRIEGRPIGVLAAIRTAKAANPGHDDGRFGGEFEAIESALPGTRLEVGPLSVAAIHQMFGHVLGGSFPRPLLVRIHRAAGGNPFYALEIAREIQRVGSPPPGRPLAIPSDDRELAMLRLRRLPRATRDVLAEVAAMPSVAIGQVDAEALAPAERAGVAAVSPEGRVDFTHPLLRSAVYASLPEADRGKLHRRLASMAGDPVERARHLALAATGPEAEIAAELDGAAAAAAARGAAELAVELQELALRLTPEASRQERVQRGIDLAERRYFAGDPNGARNGLEALLGSLQAGDDRAQVLLGLGTMRWVQGEADVGRQLMLQALAETGNPALQARIHARIASGSDDADLGLEHGQAALDLLDENANPEQYSYTLCTVTMFRLHAGLGSDHAAIDKAMRLQRAATGWVRSPVPAFWARYFDDFDTSRQRLADLIQAFREQGDAAQEAPAITQLARVEAMTGRMDLARDLAREALDLVEQTGQDAYLDLALSAEAYICAYAGDYGQARRAAAEVLRHVDAHPDPLLEGQAREALGLAALTEGDLAECDRQLTRADQINDLVHNREPANQRFHADHAEAVIGLGDTDRGERLVARLEERAAALPRPWISAVSARSRGMLHAARGDLDLALECYQRALAAHQGLDMPAELGRTLLALGRLHRRRNERQRASECLEQALALLEGAGALGWAATARQELTRTQGRRGEPEQLTPTERTVCELAASGLHNHEIAARLFLSGKTVEANLTRAYRKLNVRSRAQLAAALARSR
jgi:DNA-binding CsgD family transcriptional regulator